MWRMQIKIFTGLLTVFEKFLKQLNKKFSAKKNLFVKIFGRFSDR